ncbi:IS701 family transposase [Dehalococcoidia bacterium]|nr:IS701 family transposase [Dehalococcoidia bacterium]
MMKTVAGSQPLPELAEFLSPYMSYFRRPEVREDMERYTTGLLSDLPRKNGGTIAAVVPNTTEQRLQELLTNSTWDEETMNYQRIRQMRDKTCVGDGVLIFDDTGFPKQGKHSVGVARQYCGALGKVANCQVAVTCVYADSAGHWPVNTRLYLHRQWTDAPDRCAKAGVPQEVVFQTKPQLALALLDEARESQIPHRAVVADCGYGGDNTFLSGLEERGELYVVAVPCDFRVLVCGNECPKAQRADEVIRGLSKGKWKTIRWREGHKGWLRKKFVAVRAYRSLDGQPLTLGWLLGERPSRSQEGNWKFYFSNFPGETTLQDLVGIAHRRWLIERFHQDSKNLLGWDDYQGRLWKDFHRHAILVMLSYSFLVWQEWHHWHSAPRGRGRPRSAFSPSAGQEASVVAFCSSSSRRRPMGNGYSRANSEKGDAISASLAEITK